MLRIRRGNPLERVNAIMNDMGLGQGGAPGGGVDPQDAANNKIMGVLSYWAIGWVIAYFMARQSPFVKFHLNQGLAIWFLAIAFSIVTTVLGFVSPMLASLGGLLNLITLVFALLGSWKAWNGKTEPLPVIGGMMPTLIK